jgi:hypothetical protein
MVRARLPGMASERAIWAGKTIGRRASLPGNWPEEGMLPVVLLTGPGRPAARRAAVPDDPHRRALGRRPAGRPWPGLRPCRRAAMSAGQMIEVRGLTKRYGATLAVGGLSFTVRAGLVTGFLGPRRGQDHHHAADPRARPSHRRRGDTRRTAVPGPACAAARGRCPARQQGHAPRAACPQPASMPGPEQRHPGAPGRRSGSGW